MPIYPYPINNRPELNLRHAIKSSISELRQLIALTLSLYLSNQKSNLNYCRKEKQKIVIQDEVFDLLSSYFSEQIESFGRPDDFLDVVNRNPLFKAQIEPLQVALELFLKLCRITFFDGSASSKERTGLERYVKVLNFTTNVEIIRVAFQIQEADLKWVLFDWMISPEAQKENTISKGLKSLLTIFSEETQFRLREENNREVFFQQEGIYKAILEGNSVVAQDAHENVGTFRILKSFVSDSLHPFLRGDRQSATSNKQFIVNTNTDLSELEEYTRLVHNYLDTIPKRTTLTITEEAVLEATPIFIFSISLPDIPRNRILFGPPGTGKSSKIKKEYANTDKYPGLKKQRVTFHPDYEYGSFVGSYKPVSVEVDGRKEIQYDYVAQEFIKAYTNAWDDPEHPHFLIIEEINRGNCAQIFGDLFQSLDRNAEHFSEYEVDTDTDLATYLNAFFQDPSHSVAKSRLSDQLRKHGCPADAFSKIILPDNLYIYATMNTSDQSLFPMDSAFKRRWDWEYVPIDYKPTDGNGNLVDFKIDLGDVGMYSWSAFIEKANKRIYDATQSEDKQLGFWFIKPTSNGQISRADFKSKVLFYLWFEVFRNELDKNIFPTTVPVGATSDTESFVYGHLFDSNHEATILRFIIEKLKLESIAPITE